MSMVRAGPLIDGRRALTCGTLAYQRAVAASEIYATVVLIHGNSARGSIFSFQIDELRSEGFGVLVPDLPGHGASEDASTPDAVYSFPGYAAVVRELIDDLVRTPVILVGWSLGGHIALELLSHYTRDSADRCLGVMVFGTPPVAPSAAALAAAFHVGDDMNYAGKAEFTDADVRAYADLLVSSGLEDRGPLYEMVRRTDGRARETMLRLGLSGVGVDQVDALRRSSVPVAIVHGADDPFVRFDYLAQLPTETLWQKRVHVIDRAGHAPHVACSADFNRLLTSYCIGRLQPSLPQSRK
ncbi:MAG: alpha/beta hydrolase [Pseudomonadota bacterium]